MGYESKINRLLSNSDEKIRQCVIDIYQKDKNEYEQLKKAFESSITELMNDYTREKFNNVIAESWHSPVWKKMTSKKKNTILEKLEPILLYDKQFSDHLEVTGPTINFVFLETNHRLVAYCNGMYSPFTRNEEHSFTEDEKDHNERVRRALIIPSTTIKNAELEEYAQSNQIFPVWLKELTFLEPLLKEQTNKLKI